jgi:hypothetical protein
MKSHRSFWVLVPLLLLLVGCVSMIPVRISPAIYPRIGLVVAYPDEASLSTAAHFFGLPKNSSLPLPGLGSELTRNLAASLNAAGYQVQVLPVRADQFWRAFDAASGTKEGSSWHLGVNKNTLVTIKALQEQGLETGNVDAVLVVGPSEFYYDARFMSRKGTGVELSFLEKTPNQIGATFGASALAINTKTMELSGGGHLFKWQGLVAIPSGKTLAALSNDEKADLVQQLGAKARPVFDELTAKLR